MIMKTLNRIYILAAALLSAAPGLLGQNFNPTVEVTNVYQGDASDIHKPQLEMAVPDSLLRFDLDFDYEVFDKAYRGAYNFSPYMLDMRPEKDAGAAGHSSCGRERVIRCILMPPLCSALRCRAVSR